MVHDELKEKLNNIKKDYSGKVFKGIIESIKREKINDDRMLEDIEELSRKKFDERVWFTHYYLNGPARVEPTLRIDYFSYLKASGKQRALMHLSGVLGTVAAPIIASMIAVYKGAPTVAFNLLFFFLMLIVFELLTSTKIGDLMKAKREFENG